MDVRNEAALRRLRIFGDRQWPFALALALTKTAILGQRAVQAVTRANFRLHGEFIPKGIRVKPARKSEVMAGTGTAEIYTAPLISNWMPLHETGDMKEPGAYSGEGDKGQALAMPGEYLMGKSFKTGSGKVRKRWTPGRLLEAYNAGHGEQMRGIPHTGRGQRRKAFLMDANGTLVIARRAGRARGPLDILYAFTGPAKIKPTWRFAQTVHRVVRGTFVNQVRKAVLTAWRNS